jgi:hypothetical protein
MVWQDPFSILTTIIIIPLFSHPFKPPFITQEEKTKVSNYSFQLHGGTTTIVLL